MQLEPYQRTKTFTEETVPRGLLKDHSTKEGTYGRICVISGILELTRASGQAEQLQAGAMALVMPQEVHAVKPIGAVSFYVEFCRAVD
jgi:tellurite methyltransferase